jgi:hypothetical protein
MGDVRRISVSLSTIMGNYATEMVKAAVVTDALAESLDRLDKKSNAAFGDVSRSAEATATKIEKSSTKTQASLAATSKSLSDFDRLVRSNLQDEGTAYEAVGRSIDQYKTKIVSLRDEANRTGSGSVFGDLETAKADLGKLEGFARDLGPNITKSAKPGIDKAGVDAGKNFIQKFGGAMSNLPLMPSNPYVAAALGALGIGVAIGDEVEGRISVDTDESVRVAVDRHVPAVSLRHRSSCGCRCGCALLLGFPPDVVEPLE